MSTLGHWAGNSDRARWRPLTELTEQEIWDWLAGGIHSWDDEILWKAYTRRLQEDFGYTQQQIDEWWEGQ